MEYLYSHYRCNDFKLTYVTFLLTTLNANYSEPTRCYFKNKRTLFLCEECLVDVCLLFSSLEWHNWLFSLMCWVM